MLLKSYVRNKFKKYVRPLLIKDKCECCEETVGLELHHLKSFSDLLDECLNRLGYTYYKYKNDYTNEELDNIVNWMIGVQMKIKYITLCEKCHGNVHLGD